MLSELARSWDARRDAGAPLRALWRPDPRRRTDQPAVPGGVLLGQVPHSGEQSGTARHRGARAVTEPVPTVVLRGGTDTIPELGPEEHDGYVLLTRRLFCELVGAAMRDPRLTIRWHEPIPLDEVRHPMYAPTIDAP